MRRSVSDLGQYVGHTLAGHVPPLISRDSHSCIFTSILAVKYGHRGLTSDRELEQLEYTTR